ncbi:MAG: hypothetical protein LBJ12_05015, partial [Oscillospiraceae bacterium]|nr:hypothetical protein [Oscillospiraceae bacterium]
MESIGTPRLILSNRKIIATKGAASKIDSIWLSPYAPIIDIRLENLVVDNGDGSSAVIPCWHLCIDRKG